MGIVTTGLIAGANDVAPPAVAFSYWMPPEMIGVLLCAEAATAAVRNKSVASAIRGRICDDL